MTITFGHGIAIPFLQRSGVEELRGGKLRLLALIGLYALEEPYRYDRKPWGRRKSSRFADKVLMDF
jgi:hypothetical protein